MARRTGAAGLVLALAAFVAWAPAAAQQPVQPAPRVTPKLEPIAETRLIMEGMAHTNFRGIERLLREKPADAQTWTFIRGQSLLVAEAANLLMLRPPRTTQGQPIWFERAMDLRQVASDLGRTAGSRDFAKSRAGFVALANACNRCHQNFRIPVEIAPFQEPKAPAKT